MNEKYIEICEELGWSVNECEDGTVELETTTKYEGDFAFTVNKENFAQEVWNYYNDFDVDEYVEMYIEARKNGLAGVPSARGLVEDAEDTEKRLEELAIRLSAVKEED